MTLFLIGMSHKTAPIEMRERLQLLCSEGSEPLTELMRLDGVQEVLYLATCNRVEIVARAEDKGQAVDILKSFIYRQGNLSIAEMEKCLYIHRDLDAVRHLFRVT